MQYIYLMNKHLFFLAYLLLPMSQEVKNENKDFIKYPLEIDQKGFTFRHFTYLYRFDIFDPFTFSPRNSKCYNGNNFIMDLKCLDKRR